jgi:hypothetical protein
MMCTARSNVCLAVFCFYPVFSSPEGDNKAGSFQLHQVDVFTVVKVELVMRYYNLRERRNINHGTR